MEEAPSAVGSIQGRQVFGKEAQVIREGEERREPLRPGHPCLQGVCVSAQAPAAPRQAALSPEAFPWPLRLFCRLRESSLQEFTSTETQEAFYLSGSAASLFNLTKGSLRIPGPFLDGDLTGGRSPLRLRTPGADCWLSGILILLTRKYLYLPENPLRSVGKILDMIHVAGTLENRHFLCFSIYLSTHPLSIFYLLPLFFLSSFHPSIHHPSIHPPPIIHPPSIHPFTHPFMMPILDPEAKGRPLPPHRCHTTPPRKGASALLTPL